MPGWISEILVKNEFRVDVQVGSSFIFIMYDDVRCKREA